MPDKQIKYTLGPELEGIIQKMIDADESQENISHVIAKYEDAHDSEVTQTLKEIRGALTHIPLGMWDVVKGTLYDLPVATYDALFGDKSVSEQGKAFLDSIVNAGPEFKDKFLDATHEERGQMLGELGGQFITGMPAGKKAVDIAKHPISSVKTAARVAGTGAEWVGEHPLGSSLVGGSTMLGGVLKGDPYLVAGGAATTAVPLAAKYAGTALREWGENDPRYQARQAVRIGNAPLQMTTKDQAAALAGLHRTLGRDVGAADTAATQKATADLASVNENIAGVKKEAVKTRAASGRQEAAATTAEDKADAEMSKAEQKAARDEEKARATAERAAIIEEARKAAGVEKKAVSFGRNVSAPSPEGGTQTMRESYGTPEPTLEDELARIKAAGAKNFPAKMPTKAPPMEGVPEVAPPPIQVRPPSDVAKDFAYLDKPAAVRVASNPMGLTSSEAIPGAGRGPAPTDEQVAAANAKYKPAPVAKAWSPGMPTPEPVGAGKGIEREPAALILSPENALREAQRLKAYKASAQVEGMQSASRKAAGTLEQQMEADGLTELEKERMRRIVGTAEQP